MTTSAPPHRRSFLLQVAGTVAAGSAASTGAGAALAQQRPTGRSDTDAGASADRGGYGRTGVTDRDPSDQAGRGVGNRSGTAPPGTTAGTGGYYLAAPPRNAVTECANATGPFGGAHVYQCEGQQQREALCRRTGAPTGQTDRDSGEWGDLPGRGRSNPRGWFGFCSPPRR